MQKYKSVTIDCKVVKPYVAELILRCGNPNAAAFYADVGHMTIRRIMNEANCSVQKQTAANIMSAVYRKRLEDRRDGKTNTALSKLRIKQAQHEDRLGRLAGY